MGNLKSRLTRSAVTFAALVFGTIAWNCQAQTLPKLNVATASNAVIYGPFWVALADKLFEKHGVAINLINTNALSTGSAMLVSGDADLVVTTAFLSMRIATEGKPLKYIANLNNMSSRITAFISRPQIRTMDELAAKGTACRVITTPGGTASPAVYAGIAKKYNLKCAVSNAGTSALVLAGALSGQFDAAIVNPQEAYGAREAGKANILLDPLVFNDKVAEEIYPYRHPLSTVVGIASNLEAKRDAVTRFIAAVREASVLIAQRTPEQLGEVGAKLPEVFGTTPASALALQWKIQKSIFPKGPQAGFISAADWKSLLEAAPTVWGFANLRPDEPTLKYEAVVDMSYFNASANK